MKSWVLDIMGITGLALVGVGVSLFRIDLGLSVTGALILGITYLISGKSD